MLLIFTFFSCHHGVEKKRAFSNTHGVTIAYAKGFQLVKTKSGWGLIVQQPSVAHREPITYSIHQPLKRIVCTSTTHLPFLNMLEREEALVGFPTTDYISSPTLQKRVADGEIRNLGPDNDMNLEILTELDPEAVIAFDLGQSNGQLSKIESMGIPVYYNSDFLENSPLGRAEWIKFFGALFHEVEKADSIFTTIRNNCDSLMQMAQKLETTPSVLSGVMYGDTWFMPGGDNWSAKFFEQAGGAYVWENDASPAWLELSFESVLERAIDADFWLGTSSFESRDEMIKQDPRYAQFKAFQTGRVYNYSKKKNPSGGYDYFESGYARPDLVLADIIKILHPEALPNYETTFYEQLP